ncbi:MAG: hypothetical protein AABW88_01000 [Nanoarchaeota archaeon]
MLECFEDIIGLRGSCDSPTSISGLWIDDIGIDLAELDSIVNKSQIDSVDFFEKKRDFAIKQIIVLIHTHFSDKYKTNTILRSGRIGYGKENQETVAAAATLKGIEIELCNEDSFVDVFVSSISLQVNFAGSVNVFVYDLFQNKLLDTIAITAVSGQIVTVYPHKLYKSVRKELDIIFVYDATAFSSVKTTVTQGGCKSCGDGGSMINLNQYLSTRSISILSADAKIEDNLTASGDTGGLSLIYSIQCNYDEWLCTMSNSIALPILFKTGYEIMDFAYNNSLRLNTTTTINWEGLLKRRDEYDKRYQNSMEAVLQNIKLPQDEKCFECRQKSKHVIILP